MEVCELQILTSETQNTTHTDTDTNMMDSMDAIASASGSYVMFERENLYYSLITSLTRLTAAHSKITNILRITHYYH